MNKKIYQTPYIEVIDEMPERLLVGESGIPQDHDADAKGMFGDENMWEGYEHIWEPKTEEEKWEVWE